MTIQIQFQTKQSCSTMMAHFKSHISLFYKEAKVLRGTNDVIINTNLSTDEGLVLAAINDELSIRNVSDFNIISNQLDLEVINLQV